MGAEKKTDIKEKEKFSFPKWKVYLRIIVTAAASKTQEPAWVTETQVGCMHGGGNWKLIEVENGSRQWLNCCSYCFIVSSNMLLC